jgi:hypothetical protein
LFERIVENHSNRIVNLGNVLKNSW